MAKTTSVGKDTMKLPPQNLEAEQSVLGSILIDKNAMFKVVDIIGPEDFYASAHEKIYTAILELFERNQPIDILTLTNRLKEKELLQDVGGSGYLAELTQNVTTASHVAHFAMLVKDKKVLRDLIRTSAEIAEGVFQPQMEVEDLLDSIEQKIFSISQKSSLKNFVPIQSELNTSLERINSLQEQKGALRGLTTGFPKIDEYLSGLQRSDLVVLGARPSLGKTTLALDIARHAALLAKVSVGIFSLEMSREQVMDRLIAGQSQVPLWKLRTGNNLSGDEFAMLSHGVDQLSKTSIFIDDTPSPNILQMRAMARRLQVEHGLGLLIVDYLQLIAPRRSTDNMVAQVTEISRGLKGLARELNVPVLALSQLSRAVDQRDNKRPQLHDLRESGSIEQDADVVMLIYREKDRKDVPPEEQNVAEILIAKHRNGPTGMVKLHFDQDRVTFRSIDDRHGSDESF
jgi:replicative DNA helicase